MLKKLDKFLCCIGDVSYVGIGATIIYCGVKISKWAFNELENEFKSWDQRLSANSIGSFLFREIYNMYYERINTYFKEVLLWRKILFI